MKAFKENSKVMIIYDLNKETWKILSREFRWTEELIIKYRRDIVWKELSKNIEMLWTRSILKRFEQYLDWDVLSYYAPDYILKPEIIECFADRWNWEKLSGNCGLRLSYELLDKYADKWDWGQIINAWQDEDLFSIEFLYRYMKYIPIDGLYASTLWEVVLKKNIEKTENWINK